MQQLDTSTGRLVGQPTKSLVWAVGLRLAAFRLWAPHGHKRSWKSRPLGPSFRSLSYDGPSWAAFPSKMQREPLALSITLSCLPPFYSLSNTNKTLQGPANMSRLLWTRNRSFPASQSQSLIHCALLESGSDCTHAFKDICSGVPSVCVLSYCAKNALALPAHLNCFCPSLRLYEPTAHII